jgi:hypothetical protein
MLQQLDSCPDRTDGEVGVGLRGGLAMRHKPLLDSQVAYTTGVIGLGLLPFAMAFAAILIP